MQITRKQIPSLLDALLMLDGNDPKSPFAYTKKVRYSLAKNVRILTGRFADIEKHRMGIIREISPETFQIDKDSPQAAEFTRRWEDYESGVETIDNLMQFKLEDLNLHDPETNPEGNKLSIAALSKLGLLLQEDEVAT